MTPAGSIKLSPEMDGAPARRVFAALDAAGIKARFVGGCVRNVVLGRAVDDIDLAVTAAPDKVMAALEAAKIKAIPTGLKHGTVTAVANSRPFELTTLRRDVETDGRRAVVAFTGDWQEDAERRDFTFNALYADPDGTLYDPFDGRADLAAGRVRFIGDPDKRITEDRLRVMRFFRFNAWYGKPPIDREGFDACRAHANALGALSGERVSKELLKLLAAPDPVDAVGAMAEAGALDHWLPEYDGLARLEALIEREPEPSGLRRLAAILEEDADATVIGKRLKLSTQESLRLGLMLDRSEPLSSHPRADLYRLGRTTFIDRLLLEAPAGWQESLKLAGRWTPPELPVSGGDALKLGLAPGPKVGAVIAAVEAWWIAGDFAADRAACLAELEKRIRT